MNKTMKFIITFVLCFFLHNTNATTDQTSDFKLSNVIGHVMTEDNSSLPYANIVVLSTTDSAFVKGTTTGNDGNFNMPLPTGNYIIKITCLGFKDIFKPVNVNDSCNTDLGNIVMYEEALMLNEILVKGNRPTIKRNATGFIVSVEHSPNLQNKSLDRILNVSPGIYIDRSGNISINGRSGTTIIINDKTMRITGEQLMSYLNSIQGSDLKNIEIMTNPTSAYDAEGAGGIIRITTKKNAKQGLSGYALSRFTHTRKPTYNESVGINYSYGKITLYGNYTFSHNLQDDNSNFTEIRNNGNRNTTIEHNNYQNNNHTYRVGIDWQIADNHIFGLEYNGYSSSRKTVGTSEVLSYENETYSRNIKTDNPSKNQPYNNQLNLNYIWRIDSLGQQLKLIADYSDVKQRNGQVLEYLNKYYDKSGSLYDELNKRQSQDEQIRIYSAQMDYENKFGSKHWKFATGLKFSNVKTDYSGNMFNWRTGNTPTEDMAFHDHFKYDETMYAIYANAAYSGKNLEGNVGLRGEYTKTKGTSYVTNEKNSNDYFRLFPSAFLYFKPNNIHGFMLYYGMRITRPEYQLLNPFTYYINDITLRRGNPNIKSYITNNIELTYVLRNKYYFSVRASFDRKPIQDYQYLDNGMTVMTSANVDAINYYYCTAYAPFDLGIWNSTLSFNGGLLETKAEGRTVHSFSMGLSWNNYIQINDKLGCEANFTYSPPEKQVHYEFMRHICALNLGIDYNFIKNKCYLSAGIDDVFNSRGKRHVKSYYNDIISEGVYIPGNMGRSYWVSLKFNFNTGKRTNVRNKDKSNSEEMNRL